MRSEQMLMKVKKAIIGPSKAKTWPNEQSGTISVTKEQFGGSMETPAGGDCTTLSSGNTFTPTLGNFYQYVSCPTRWDKILDLCYGSVKNTYKSLPLPPLDCCYVVRRICALQECFKCTEWEVFSQSCGDDLWWMLLAHMQFFVKT